MAAPALDSSTLPRTPAHEWAKETANALSPDEKPTAEFKPDDKATFESKQSAVSTPGHDLPGAFPKTSEHETAPDPLPSAEQVKGAGASVIDTAKAYLPAQQDVEKMLEKAKGYLPQAVQGYFPATSATTEETKPTSLPSQEVHGDTSGKSDGVGPLPGSINEPAVAKLPDERTEEEKKPLEPEHPIITTTNIIPHTSSYHSQNETTLSAHPVTAKDDKIVDNVPHQEGGSPVHTLPQAPIREFSSVADQGHEEDSSHEHRVTGSRPHEPPTVTNTSEKEKQTDTFDKVKQTHIPEVQFQNTAQPPKVHDEHHVTTSIPIQGISAVDERPTTSAPLEGQAEPMPSGLEPSHRKSPSASVETETESTKRRKAGFMDKVKGEVKVLSGKMKHDEKKIEEGRKLMGKE